MRGKDPVIADRDRQILNEFISGAVTMQELADKHGVTRQRIQQVIAQFARSDIPEDVNFDKHVIMLENIQSQLYRFVNKGPQPKVDLRGNMVDGPDGNYLYDHAEWGTLISVWLKTNESHRRLTGIDRPRRKQTGLEAAQIEMLAEVARLKKSVKGEVVREIDELLPEPPGEPVIIDDRDIQRPPLGVHPVQGIRVLTDLPRRLRQRRCPVHDPLGPDDDVLLVVHDNLTPFDWFPYSVMDNMTSSAVVYQC